MRRTNGSERRSEQQKRHRAAALQNLAEMMMLWNSRKRRGVRQPYATLGACPFAGGIRKWTRKFIGSRNPPPYVGGYNFCVGSFWQIGAWFPVPFETVF